jgi:hypothetical protein
MPDDAEIMELRTVMMLEMRRGRGYGPDVASANLANNGDGP